MMIIQTITLCQSHLWFGEGIAKLRGVIVTNGQQSQHLRVLEKLSLERWVDFDEETISRDLVEFSPRHLQAATYTVAGLSFNCKPGMYHPDVNSSSVFGLRHLMDKALFSSRIGQVLEIGTGCGVILLALKNFLVDGSFTGVDIDPVAVACAKANALANNVVADFMVSDLFSALMGRQFNTILFNVPLYGGEVQAAFSHRLKPVLCDYQGELLQRFMEQLPNYLAPDGNAYIIVANTNQLASLDKQGLAIDVLAFERFTTGFMRILVRLRRETNQ
jgi:methylase of polypeptide subunit release factors